MITRPIQLIKKILFPLLIAFTAVFLCYKNYTFNTWLSGWDTLHPEFNFSLAFGRMINGVWRADQGLGAVAIQSHMADLPRVIYLWLASFVFPLSFLRYSYFFLMLIVGPLGIYFLVRHILNKSKYAELSAFISGLVYLFNLGTLQHFILPLEMFATQYGLLPWIFLIIIKILQQSKRYLWVILFFLSLFSSSQAHTATLFYAYCLGLLLFLIFYGVFYCNNWKKIIFILILVLGTNAFWLFPNMYAVINQGEAVRNSKVNRLFSPEAFAKNQNYGKIKDAVIFKNFLFDWEIYDYRLSEPKYSPVFESWNNHLNNLFTQSIGYLVFVLCFAGVAIALLRREKTFLSFLPVFGLAFLMLLNGTWPINFIFQEISKIIPLLAEALRFPYTKFSILLMFSYAIFSGYFLNWIFQYFNKKWFSFIVTVIFSTSLFYYFLPAFDGNLTHPLMKISIPARYFEMFKWFNKQDLNGRTAILPIHSFWNWTYYDWGYQGAGFLQFGIPQPILDRDYDRWSPFNEQYQREMSDAIYSENPLLVKSVIEKYQIKYLIFDESVISASGRDEETYKWAIPAILEKTELIDNMNNFEGLMVYTLKTSDSNLHGYNELPFVGPVMFGSSRDYAFYQNGDYYTLLDTNQIFSQFRGDFSPNEQFNGFISSKTLVGEIVPEQTELNSLVPCSSSEVYKLRQIANGKLNYVSEGGSLCDYFSFPNLPHQNAYLFEIHSEFINGFPLQLCISNDFSRHCDVYTHLPKTDKESISTFVILPKNSQSWGYTVNLNNFSIKNQSSQNNLLTIRVYEVKESEFFSADTNSHNTKIEVNSKHIDSWLYKTDLPNSGFKIISLDQSFHSGWLGIGNNKILRQHVLVNNWENGWIIPPLEDQKPITIYLLYWPQILEFLGFGLMGITLLKCFNIKTPVNPGS